MPSTLNSISERAPAKLNLFLHVTGRREDGYHELQTLFQLLDFGDSLTLSRTEQPGISLHLSGGFGQRLPAESNLALRAARLLARETGKPLPGTRIELHKRIPLGGGLGGGSSDAAAVLRGLNTLWDLQLPDAGLAELGLQLGADVPVFLAGYSAWAEGVGEKLQPIDLPTRYYVVLSPQVEVSTAEVFTQEDLTRNTPPIKIADFLAGGSRNDCQPVTTRLYPEVAKALNWLENFSPARMTGTGACVFAEFDDAAAAQAVVNQVPPEYRAFAARGVNKLEDLSYTLE